MCYTEGHLSLSKNKASSMKNAYFSMEKNCIDNKCIWKKVVLSKGYPPIPIFMMQLNLSPPADK